MNSQITHQCPPTQQLQILIDEACVTLAYLGGEVGSEVGRLVISIHKYAHPMQLSTTHNLNKLLRGNCGIEIQNNRKGALVVSSESG